MQISDLERVHELESDNFPKGWSKENIAQEILEDAFSFVYVSVVVP